MRSKVEVLEASLESEKEQRLEAETAQLAAEEAVAVVVSRAGGAEAERQQQLRAAHAELGRWKRSAQEAWRSAEKESKLRHATELDKASKTLIPSASTRQLILSPTTQSEQNQAAEAKTPAVTIVTPNNNGPPSRATPPVSQGEENRRVSTASSSSHYTPLERAKRSYRPPNTRPMRRWARGPYRKRRKSKVAAALVGRARAISAVASLQKRCSRRRRRRRCPPRLRGTAIPRLVSGRSSGRRCLISRCTRCRRSSTLWATGEEMRLSSTRLVTALRTRLLNWVARLRAATRSSRRRRRRRRRALDAGRCGTGVGAVRVRSAQQVAQNQRCPIRRRAVCVCVCCVCVCVCVPDNAGDRCGDRAVADMLLLYSLLITADVPPLGDVAIIGAGASGVAMANAFSRQGCRSLTISTRRPRRWPLVMATKLCGRPEFKISVRRIAFPILQCLERSRVPRLPRWSTICNNMRRPLCSELSLAALRCSRLSSGAIAVGS